ncbi:hypothetical protein BGZ61DRAFT_60122 [Ilyonectria robusta]|uniref:uncharacterized protein n=1 Tax=Ilyonectria robusta TaxID=1079257 RepID=UPI001E8E596B|nr:uncharacterized protein BGZ61DRAFT_60122 [Ilyonectria robusta]KAH8684139.1 hypothetical protein BGZ61DRAFT_60122 [Ilyonectria robusta]
MDGTLEARGRAMDSGQARRRIIDYPSRSALSGRNGCPSRSYLRELKQSIGPCCFPSFLAVRHLAATRSSPRCRSSSVILVSAERHGQRSRKFHGGNNELSVCQRLWRLHRQSPLGQNCRGRGGCPFCLDRILDLETVQSPKSLQGAVARLTVQVVAHQDGGKWQGLSRLLGNQQEVWLHCPCWPQ